MAPRPARLVPGLLVVTMLTLAACGGSGRVTRRTRDDPIVGADDDRHGAGFDDDHLGAGMVHGGEGGPWEQPAPERAVGEAHRDPRRQSSGLRPRCSSSRAPRCPATGSSTSARSRSGESDDQFLTLEGGALVQATFQGTASDDYRPGTQTVPGCATLTLRR